MHVVATAADGAYIARFFAMYATENAKGDYMPNNGTQAPPFASIARCYRPMAVRAPEGKAAEERELSVPLRLYLPGFILRS